MLLRAEGAADSAVLERFDQSLAVARDQKARLFELRAAVDMARFKRDIGHVQEGRSLLASALEPYTEGFETPDLKAARALLADLAPLG
jgi:hypothetical protein